MASALFDAPDHLVKRGLAFAADYPDLGSAVRGAEAVRESVGIIKVGLELFTASGKEAVRALQDLGFDVFLDLKLHDIPETVERATAVACSLGARFLTVHASGGPRMMEAAQRRAEREGSGLILLGVTVLTSLDQEDLVRLGVGAELEAHVLRLAGLSRSAGVPGVVCSVSELPAMRGALGPDAVLVSPGIRGPGAPSHDQKRVATPSEAAKLGANILVVGRPIRDAEDPGRAAAEILKDMRRVP